MSLREKVINGFTEMYVENERAMVCNLLQTGRIDREEWDEISKSLLDLTEDYEEGDLTPEKFLKQRKNVRKKFSRPKEEKKPGLTGGDAEDLYRDMEEEQKEMMKKALEESGKSTPRIALKIALIKINFVISRLKNI